MDVAEVVAYQRSVNHHLLHRGFTYRKDRWTGTKQTWRCTWRACPGRVHTDAYLIVLHATDHNHVAPDQNRVAARYRHLGEEDVLGAASFTSAGAGGSQQARLVEQYHQPASHSVHQPHQFVLGAEGTPFSAAPASSEDIAWCNHLIKTSPELPYDDGSRDGLGGGNDDRGEQSTHGEESPLLQSPETLLVETQERENTPPPSTPTPQKPESYQLRHNNHLSIVLEALARDESFMDVTLTAQGRSIKAHKSVLSAVSSYFRGVLRDNPCQHPIIIMPRDVRYEELCSIVTYIYRGEMTVAAEDLSSLLKTAEILEVSGLAPSDSTAAPSHYYPPPHPAAPAAPFRSSSSSSSSSSSKRGAHGQQSSVSRPDPKSQEPLNPMDFMDVDMSCVKEEIHSGGEEEERSTTAGPSKSGKSKSSVTRKGQPIIPSDVLSNCDQSQSQVPSLQETPEMPQTSGFPTLTPLENSIPSHTVNTNITHGLPYSEDQGYTDPYPHVCPHCQEMHRGEEAMTSHLRLKHPTKPSFMCDCGRVFLRQGIKDQHAKNCTGKVTMSNFL